MQPSKGDGAGLEDGGGEGDDDSSQYFCLTMARLSLG